MRFYIPATALGFALAAGAPVAHAQTVITRGVVNAPVETIQTTETVRTVRPALSRAARRQVVTTRTITRRFVPAPTVIARTVPATPRPLYDEVAPTPIAASSDYGYTPPLYDEVMPVAASVAAPLPVVANGSVVATEPYIYRYVYEPGRILVVDPNTNIAVQSIPR